MEIRRQDPANFGDMLREARERRINRNAQKAAVKAASEQKMPIKIRCRDCRAIFGAGHTYCPNCGSKDIFVWGIA